MDPYKLSPILDVSKFGSTMMYRKYLDGRILLKERIAPEAPIIIIIHPEYSGVQVQRPLRSYQFGNVCRLGEGP